MSQFAPNEKFRVILFFLVLMVATAAAIFAN
jgi:hypothetical protein